MSVLVFVWRRVFFIKVTEANKRHDLALGHRLAAVVSWASNRLPGEERRLWGLEAATRGLCFHLNTCMFTESNLRCTDDNSGNP